MVDLFKFCLHFLVFSLELDNVLGKGAFILLQALKLQVILMNFLLKLIFIPDLMSKFLIVVIFILLLQPFISLYSILNLQQHCLDLFFLNCIFLHIKLRLFIPLLKLSHTRGFFKQFEQLEVIHPCDLVYLSLLDDMVRVRVGYPDAFHICLKFMFLEKLVLDLQLFSQVRIPYSFDFEKRALSICHVGLALEIRLHRDSLCLIIQRPLHKPRHVHEYRR